jgi:mannose PTS system EIID component
MALGCGWCASRLGARGVVTGTLRSFLRLLIFQASWTYERLQGIGMGYASIPLLAPLRRDQARHAEAVARASEYFNSHPYLAGIAVGATAKAEHDGLPGQTIARLRTALSGPLGSLGDQLFWIGVVPAVIGALLIAVSREAGLQAVLVGSALYIAVRIVVTWWGLRLGLRSGVGVAEALRRSGLSDQVRRVGLLAGLVVGIALPLVVDWFSPPGTNAVRIAASLGALGGVVAALVRFRVPPARRLTVLAMAGAILLQWGIR